MSRETCQPEEHSFVARSCCRHSPDCSPKPSWPPTTPRSRRRRFNIRRSPMAISSARSATSSFPAKRPTRTARVKSSMGSSPRVVTASPTTRSRSLRPYSGRSKSQRETAALTKSRSAAWMRSIRCASSACGATGSGLRASTGPRSVAGVTRWTVAPAHRLPAVSASWTACGPRNAGSACRRGLRRHRGWDAAAETPDGG